MDMQLVHTIEEMLTDVGNIREYDEQPVDQGATLAELRPADKQRIVVLVQELVSQVDASYSMNQSLSELKAKHQRELDGVNNELKNLRESYDQLQANSKIIRVKSRERALESLATIRKKDEFKYKTKFVQMKEAYESNRHMLSARIEDLELKLRAETIKKQLGSLGDAESSDYRNELLILKQDEATWRNEKITLELKLKNALEENRKFVAQVDELDTSVAYLSRDLTEKNVEINKLTVDLENEKLSLAAAKLEVKDLEAKMNDLRLTAINKCMVLGDKNTNLKTANKAAKVELQNVVFHMEECTNASSAKCRMLEESLRTLKHQAQNELSAANRKIEELRSHTDGVTTATNKHKGLEEKVAGLRRELSEREAEMSLMREKHREDKHAWHTKIGSLKRSVKESEFQLKRLHEEKELMKRGYESKLSRVKDNTKENEDLLSEQQKYRQALEIEMRNLKEAKDALQAKLIDERSAIISQQTSLQSDSRHHDKKSVQLTRDLQQSYIKLEALLKQEREDNKSRIDQIEVLEKKLMSLTAEITVLNDKLAKNSLTFDMDRRSLHSLVFELKQENKALESELAALQAKTAHNNSLLAQVRRYQANEASLKQELKVCEDKLEKTTRGFRSDRVDDEVASLRKCKLQLTEDLAESIREKHCLETEIRHLRENERSFKSILENRNQELDTEKREIKRLNEDVGRLRKTLEETELRESKEKFLLISQIKTLEAKESALKKQYSKSYMQPEQVEQLVKGKRGAENKLSEVHSGIRSLATHIYRLEEKHNSNLSKLSSIFNTNGCNFSSSDNKYKEKQFPHGDWELVPHIKSLEDTLSKILTFNHDDFSSDVEKLMYQMRLVQGKNKFLEDQISSLNIEITTQKEKFASAVASHEIELDKYKREVSSLTDCKKKLEEVVEALSREKSELTVALCSAHNQKHQESKLTTASGEKSRLEDKVKSIKLNCFQQSEYTEEALYNYQNRIQALRTALNESEHLQTAETEGETSDSDGVRDSKAYMNSKLMALENMFYTVLKENLGLHALRKGIETDHAQFESKYSQVTKSMQKLEADLKHSEISMAGCSSSLRQLPPVKNKDKPKPPLKSGKVAKAEEASLDHRIKAEIKARPMSASSTSNSSRSSQGRLLAGAVVRKRSGNAADAPPSEKKSRADSPTDKTEADSSTAKRKSCENGESDREVPGMRCIGILPGLGSYPDSSDSEASSDTDQELPQECGKMDLLGRKITHPKPTTNSSASH